MRAPFVQADLFDLPGILVIPTNAGKVHGAGLARAAVLLGIINDADRVLQVDVKRHWRERADLDLVRAGLNLVVHKARRRPDTPVHLPLIGCGHGEGDPGEILPLLVRAAGYAPNVVIVVPTEEALASTPKGRARTDHTALNLPRILAYLSET